MLIAQAKRKTNIAEYLLYMWQLEDLFRANNLDEKALYKVLIAPLSLDEIQKKEIWQWYQGLLKEMVDQRLQKAGHRAELSEIMLELNFLHQTLLGISKDQKYIDIYAKAKTDLDLLKSKSAHKNQSDIETALNGLYGLLILRLKKEEISKETETAMASFSAMIAYLVAVYHKIQKGELTLPGNS